MMKTTNHVPSGCPVCLARLDRSTDIGGDFTPKAGDIGICAYCAGLVLYKEDMTLSPFPDAEFKMLSATLQTTLRQQQQSVRNAAKKEPPRT